MKKTVALAVVCACALILPVPARAQSSGWYAGGELGVARVEFRPYYEYPAGTPDQYFDRAKGTEIAALAGREWALTPRVTLGAQGRLAYTGARWSTTFTDTEHSDFRYDIGPTLTVSAVPAFRVTSRFWVTAEAGAGTVRVRETKTSTDSTHYSAQPWAFCYVAGVGGRVALTPRVNALMSYRYQRATSFTYHSFLPDGREWETITDRPVAGRFTAGLAYRF